MTSPLGERRRDLNVEVRIFGVRWRRHRGRRRSQDGGPIYVSQLTATSIRGAERSPDLSSRHGGSAVDGENKAALCVGRPLTHRRRCFGCGLLRGEVWFGLPPPGYQDVGVLHFHSHIRSPPSEPPSSSVQQSAHRTAGASSASCTHPPTSTALRPATRSTNLLPSLIDQRSMKVRAAASACIALASVYQPRWVLRA